VTSDGRRVSRMATRSHNLIGRDPAAGAEVRHGPRRTDLVDRSSRPPDGVRDRARRIRWQHWAKNLGPRGKRLGRTGVIEEGEGGDAEGGKPGETEVSGDHGAEGQQSHDGGAGGEESGGNGVKRFHGEYFCPGVLHRACQPAARSAKCVLRQQDKSCGHKSPRHADHPVTPPVGALIPAIGTDGTEFSSFDS
jgi:hypothetical protein